MRNDATLLGLILTFAACTSGSQVTAARPYAGCGAACQDRITIGTMLPVSTSWTGTCEDSPLGKILDAPRDGSPRVFDCHANGYDVEVKCKGACRVWPAREGDDARDGSQRLVVTPLARGPFSFEVRMRAPGGEPIVFKSPEMVVHPPDSVGLLCRYPVRYLESKGALASLRAPLTDDPEVMEPCDGRAMAPDKAFIYPVVETEDRRNPAPAALLNGRFDLPIHRVALTQRYEALSLADLFPHAVTGTQLADGVYPVVVEVDGARATYAIRVAR
ncbi:MAG: hypothetical protein ABI867_11335 [Kofleriaceae bacterium]